MVYLPSGDAALTRRARKHSVLAAVVVRFSRLRGRYERQGLLVEESALAEAERECVADAEQRRTKREQDKLRRAEQDRDFTALMSEAILKLFPRCPSGEAQAIAAHTAVRGSGRVGRTSAGRALQEQAVTAAVVAAIRHKYTDYDRILMEGYSRMDARHIIRDAIDRVVQRWRCPDRGSA